MTSNLGASAGKSFVKTALLVGALLLVTACSPTDKSVDLGTEVEASAEAPSALSNAKKACDIWADSWEGIEDSDQIVDLLSDDDDLGANEFTPLALAAAEEDGDYQLLADDMTALSAATLSLVVTIDISTDAGLPATLGQELGYKFGEATRTVFKDCAGFTEIPKSLEDLVGLPDD